MKRKSTEPLPSPSKKRAVQRKAPASKAAKNNAAPKRASKAPPKRKATSSRTVKKAVSPKKKVAARKVTKKSPPASKKKVTAKKTVAKKKPTAKGKNAARKTPKKTTQKAAPKKKQAQAKVKPEPAARKPKHPNDKLVPNNDIKLVTKDPMFEDKNENSMPETGPYNITRKAIRAVLTNDMQLLQRLIKSTNKVSNVFGFRSSEINMHALHYAVEKGNKKAVSLLVQEVLTTDKKRAKLLPVSLSKSNTGRYNYISLGHATRPISMSRGSREGNDAFIEDSSIFFQRVNMYSIGAEISKLDASYDSIQMLLNCFGDQKKTVQNSMQSNMTDFIARGQYKIAGILVKKSYDSDGYGFNKLHYEVLTCNSPEELTPFRSISVRKKSYLNSRVTPLHLACINPNPDILQHLLSICPDFFLKDTFGLSLLHYAAVCEGTGPMEVLLERGVYVSIANNQLETPLMLAAKSGRLHNVLGLLKYAKPAGTPSDGTPGMDIINMKSRSTFSALYLAAENGHTEVCRALIDNGALIEVMTSAGRNKVRPLMIAAARGHLETVKLLVEKGAIIEAKDKLKKTALIHAVKNGSYPVACYLLRKGATPNVKDSSGNTAIHYAAGYGWWHCIKLLLLAGADPSTMNDWKVPPLGIAFMKGHSDCADLLFDQPGVDVNFRDSDGWTLVITTVAHQVSEHHLEQLKFLINKKRADVTLTDVDGWTALHHLASNQVPRYQGDLAMKDNYEKTVAEMANLLIQHGCDPSAKTNSGETPLNICASVDPVNTGLMKLLVKHGSDIALDITGDDKKNLFHHMATRLRQRSTTEIEIFDLITEKLSKSNGVADLKTAMNAVDTDGFTPLLRVMEMYETSMPRHPAEAFPKNVEIIIKKFIEVGGADINCVIDKEKASNSKGSVLHYAIHPFNNPKKSDISQYRESVRAILRELLSHKPQLDVTNQDGLTPLHLAVSFGALGMEALEDLIDAGANVNLPSMRKDKEDPDKLVEGNVPLIIAASSSLLPSVQKLISMGASVTAVDVEKKRNALHLVTRSSGNVDEIMQTLKILLKKGVDINSLDMKQRSALHLAVEGASADIVEFLLDEGADPFALDIYGRLPIHYAFVKFDKYMDTSKLDPIEVVSILTTAMKGQRLKTRDKWGQTVLHRAAVRGATISFTHLMEFDLNADEKDYLGNTPLCLAAEGKHDSLIISLLQMDVEIIGDITVPNAYYKRWKDELNNTKNKKWILKRLRAKPPQETFKSTILRSVVMSGLEGVLYLMIDKIQRKRLPKTPVLQAILIGGKPQLALSLLRKRLKNEDVSKLVNKDKQNLLHILTSHIRPKALPEHIQLADELVKRGVKLSAKDVNGRLPLTSAINLGDVAFCEFLFRAVKGDVKALLQQTDTKGRSSYTRYFRFWSETRTDLWRLLVKYGMDPNGLHVLPMEDDSVGYKPYCLSSPDENNNLLWKVTALINAIVVGNESEVKFYIKEGVSVNATDACGLTPLMHAAKKNDIVMVKLLLNPDYEMSKEEKNQASLKMTTMGQIGAMTWGKGKPPRGNLNFNLGNDDDDEIEDEDEDMEDEEDDNEIDDDEDDNPMDDDEDVNEDDENKGDTEDSSNKKKEQGKDFKKTSDVDIRAVDQDDQNVFHHLLLSSIYGTFENVEILNLLAKFVPKSELSKKSALGKTPLMMAVEARASRLVKEFEKLTGEKAAKPISPYVEKPWSDDFALSSSFDYDFREDAESMVKKIEESQPKGTDEDDIPRIKVDSRAQLQGGVEVLMDNTQNIPYSVFMTKVDIQYGEYGMNNFYKMQVIHQKGKDMYILFTCWGRIGDEGQFQKTPFPFEADAVKEFKSIFKAKSGNDWAQVKSFENKPKKYRLIDVTPHKSANAIKDFNLDLSSTVASTLPKSSQELMKQLTCSSVLNNLLKTSNIGPRVMPYGHFTSDAFQRAKDIIENIRTKLKSIEQEVNSCKFTDKGAEVMDEVMDLSNDFYRLIPYSHFSHEKMEPLNTLHRASFAEKDINNMIDLALASKIVFGAQFRVKELNPLDYIYGALNCKIKILEEDSDESQMILEQMQSSSERFNLKVEAIFKIEREGEKEEQDKLPYKDRHLLWHGTNTANLLSILKRGLLTLPLENAYYHGNMLGAGIYFAPAVGKSLSYCSKAGNTSQFLLLSEVALGKVQTVKMDGEDAPFDKTANSCFCAGTTSHGPNGYLRLPSGASIGFSPLKKDPQSRYYGPNYDEYVVYSEQQVRLRYLVQFDNE